jgi:hypothetical protein
VREEMNEQAKNRSPAKKLACVVTSNAKLAKIKIIAASTFVAEQVYFFCTL